jgi:hypothetical protein
MVSHENLLSQAVRQRREDLLDSSSPSLSSSVSLLAFCIHVTSPVYMCVSQMLCNSCNYTTLVCKKQACSSRRQSTCKIMTITRFMGERLDEYNFDPLSLLTHPTSWPIHGVVSRPTATTYLFRSTRTFNEPHSRHSRHPQFIRVL